MSLPKVCLSDCVTSRSTRFPCQVSLAPHALLTKLPSRLKPMPFSVPQQDGTTLFPLNFSRLAPSVDLVLMAGIHSISLTARYRFAACSSTLSRGLEKFSTARGHNCTHLFALFPVWEEFLVPSMAFNTPSALDIVFRLDRDDT